MFQYSPFWILLKIIKKYFTFNKRLSRDDNDGKKESESISNQDKILRQYVLELSKKEPQNRFIIVKDYTD